MPEKIIVAVGMSGGVDSTVAALLLRDQGFAVVGVSMKLWSEGSAPALSGCSSPQKAVDIQDAADVCRRLGIPHHIVDVSKEYARRILQNFRDEYRAGRTPNPCVLCNPLIKFGALWDETRRSGIAFDQFATGHYARIVKNTSTHRYELLKAANHLKDQSYFLYRLNQEQLARTLFPLGEMTKRQVIEMAEQAGFGEIAHKPESQDFADAASRQFSLPEDQRVPGRIIDTLGQVLGGHNDIGSFTLGQRKGLRIGGLKDPVYVIAIDPVSGDVTVGPKSFLAVERLTAGMCNWIAVEKPDTPLRAAARCRSKQEECPCVIIPAAGDTVTVEFSELQYSATPGQSIVFYKGERVLGGGII